MDTQTPRPWWQGRMCTFDTETTGTDPTQSRLVTATIALVGGGRPSVTQNWLCDPGIPIPTEASDIHGVTTERARAEGRPPLAVIPEIALLLTVACHEGWPIVVFNAPYDLTLMLHELERLEQHRHFSALPHRLQDTALIVDPLVIDRGLDKYRKGSRKLADMCAHYGVALDNAHDAAADALASARLVYKLGQKYGDDLSDLVELQAVQRSWYRDWAVGFADHLRRKGETATDLHPDGWPFRLPARQEIAA